MLNRNAILVDHIVWSTKYYGVRRLKMLVLSRKLGEITHIGDNIQIVVVDIDRGKVRLGIIAPRDVAIYRQELLPHIDQSKPTNNDGA